MEHVPGPVDDRLEQLVPGPRGRRQAGDLVQEAQLLELVVGGRAGVAPGAPAAVGAGGVGRGSRCWSRASPYKPRERLRPGRLRSGGGSDAERSVRWPRVRPSQDAPPAVAGGRRRAARDRHGRRARPARGRGPAARRPARPGHRRAGRTRAVRARRADPAPDDRPAPRRRPGRAGAARRGAARPRPRRRRGGHRRLRAVLRAGQPGRGARPGAGPAPARARGARRRPRRFGRPTPSPGCAGSGGRTPSSTRSSAGSRSRPVLTAHPTEARRRTTLVALRRCADPAGAARRPAADPVARIARSAAGCARRSRCCGGRRTCASSARRRSTRSGPRWPSSTPRCSRSSRGCTGRSTRPSIRRPAGRRGPASDTGRTGTRPPRVGPFLRPGSWIGGDRDGNPGVTAEITERTLRIHADHVLRGYEAVATRLMQTVAAATSGGPGRAAARVASRPRRRGPPRDRPPAPPALPGRAVPPALRVHRRAAAPDAGRARRRAGAADRPLRLGRPSSTRSSPRSRRRSSPTASTASPAARSPSCAGRSGRSGSTSPRSRSASTRRSTGRPWRRSGPGRRARRSCRRA